MLYRQVCDSSRWWIGYNVRYFIILAKLTNISAFVYDCAISVMVNKAPPQKKICALEYRLAFISTFCPVSLHLHMVNWCFIRGSNRRLVGFVPIAYSEDKSYWLPTWVLPSVSISFSMALNHKTLLYPSNHVDLVTTIPGLHSKLLLSGKLAVVADILKYIPWYMGFHCCGVYNSFTWDLERAVQGSQFKCYAFI